MKKNIFMILVVSFFSFGIMVLSFSSVKAFSPVKEKTFFKNYAPVQKGKYLALNQKDSQKLLYPTTGKISQGFKSGHYAIDIDTPYGASLWAAQTGTVIKVVDRCLDAPAISCGGGYGNYIIIDHGNGFKTLYAHLHTIVVKLDDHVQKGDVIGTIGRSGRVRQNDPTHLHFEVIEKGIKKNPKNYL